MRIAISADCSACGACLLTCPTPALRRAPKRPEVIQEECILCLGCVEVCPTNAIVLEPA